MEKVPQCYNPHGLAGAWGGTGLGWDYAGRVPSRGGHLGHKIAVPRRADSRTAPERGIYAASTSKLFSTAKRHECRAPFGFLNPPWGAAQFNHILLENQGRVR
jgi:hypothetical protein